MVALGAELARRCIPDLLRAIVTRNNHEAAVPRVRHGINRLSYIAQVINPCATRNRPDRGVALGAAGQEARIAWIPAQTTDARPGNREDLRPCPCIKHADVVTSARRQPMTVRAEGDGRISFRFITELGEEGAGAPIPDVRNLPIFVDRSNIPVVGRYRDGGITWLHMIAQQFMCEGPVRCVPDPDSAITAGGNESGAVGVVH